MRRSLVKSVRTANERNSPEQTTQRRLSNLPGRWRLRCGCAATATAAVPIAAATTRAAEEQGHAESDQKERPDEMEHADGDEAEVFGDAECADDDQCDGEDSHVVLRVEVKGFV
jgi:hypothetical protein